MARFYGWTDHYMRTLSTDKFEDYFLAMPPLEARELSTMVKASIYPHMKKEKAAQQALNINRQLRENISTDDLKSHSTKEFAEILTKRV